MILGDLVAAGARLRFRAEVCVAAARNLAMLGLSDGNGFGFMMTACALVACGDGGQSGVMRERKEVTIICGCTNSDWYTNKCAANPENTGPLANRHNQHDSKTVVGCVLPSRKLFSDNRLR